MSEKIPARFRKTKTDKWAVMAPVEDLEKALAEGGKVDVLKKSGDWSTFQIASLGRPFDVDGVQMCYGYGPEEESEGGGGTGPEAGDRPRPEGAGRPQDNARRRSPAAGAPPRDETEPLPEYQGGPEDEWSEF
ncbi:MAG: hypothetical protein OEV40_18285 [Acidimicrobiia bacterium]|nr:hypothetical protein [Acidimicrobiia bacterium]